MRILTAAFFVLFAQFSLAADLTEADVKHWTDAMPGLQAWLTQHEDQMPDTMPDGTQGIEEMISQGVQDLKSAGLYDEYNSKVKAAGYSSVEDWASATQRVSMAYLALELESQPVSLAQLEAQLKQIQESDLPAEQKDMMTQMMSSSIIMMKAVGKVSDADKNAVRPYKDQLQASFDAE